MPLPLDALEAEALNVPAVDRSHLLGRLIASLEADPDVQEAWAIEAACRDAEIEEGKVTLVSGEEVLARLRAEIR